jgi:ADP-heptose:LPS heptosyltransferase
MLQTKPNLGDRDRLTAEERESAAAAIFKRYLGKRRLAIRILEAFLKPLVWMSKTQANPSLDEVERILVFEPGSLGDLVMLTPFLRSLRAGFPKAKLSLLCRTSGLKEGQSYASISQAGIETLLLDQGFVEELIPVPVPWLVDVSIWKKYSPFSLNWPKFLWRLRQLNSRNFDLAFSGGRSDFRYNLALWFTGAKRRVGYGYAGGSFLLTDVVVPDTARPHQTELSLQLIEHLGIAILKDGQLVNLSSRDDAFSLKFLKERGIASDDLVVGVHPGSRVPTRQWGEERFREVAGQLAETYGAKVVWFAEPNHSAVPHSSGNIISISLPLREFLAVLSRCRFLVCNESGPMHMAAAVGVPVVSVFGSGFPEWFRPLGEGHRIVIRRDVWCRPCADRCIFKEPYCLRLIPVEQVMHAVEEMLRTVAGNYIGAGGRE